MSCECYKIGGPFIAEDPNCPTHGREAQEREAEREALEERVSSLEEQVRELQALVRSLVS